MSNVFFAHTASHYRLTPLPCGFASLAIISRYSAKRSQFGHFQVCGKFSLSQPTHLHPRWWRHIAQFNYTGSWGNTSMQPDFSYQQRYSHHFHPSLGDANAWLTQPLSQLSPLSLWVTLVYIHPLRVTLAYFHPLRVTLVYFHPPRVTHIYIHPPRVTHMFSLRNPW